MKDITVEHFKDNIDDTISSALSIGEIYCISTEKGNVVLMEEAEYNVLRDATAILLTQK